ncbi:MAG: c-type cytochrome [Planctomycetaceae bacterium]|nr:c-type cytochrome [Planctomycetaceae bacterium]
MKRQIAAVGLGVVLLFLAGCASENQTENKSKSDKSKTTSQSNETKPEESITSTAKPTKVQLDNNDLASGIPGTGPLKVEEIKTWLEDPSNHVALEVELPLGLNVGKIPEGVLEKNPLTPAKIELGRQLYFDTRLSSDDTISCASCHHPEKGYAFDSQFGIGVGGQQGGRNSPVSYNRILSTLQFWDGRADSLEAQAVGPIANPIEMANTHEVAVETLKGIEGYKIQFDEIFDDGVTIDNVGKAIAAFERIIVTSPSAFDYYEQLKPFATLDPEDIADDEELKAKYDMLMSGAKENPMSDSAKRGYDLFFSDRVACSACHVGGNLADENYHNLGIGMDAEKPDLGRFEITKVEKDKGAFKTPTIRNVALSGPYMHDGSLKTLEEVVEHYNKGGTPNPWLSDKIKKLNLTDQEKKDLVEFMKACTGDFPKVETNRLPE